MAPPNHSLTDVETGEDGAKRAHCWCGWIGDWADEGDYRAEHAAHAADDMTPAERHEFRVATLIVRISAAQKRMAENFARMAERLVELADAQAEMHKATEELSTLLRAAKESDA